MMILGLPWFIKYEVWMLIDDMIYGNTTHECWLYMGNWLFMRFDSTWDNDVIWVIDIDMLHVNHIGFYMRYWNVYDDACEMQWYWEWYVIGIEYLGIWMLHMSHMT